MADATFELKIITIGRVFFDGACRQLIIPSVDGMIGIMAHHENAIISVVEGEAHIQNPDGSWTEAATGIGQVQVENNRVTVIVDSMERPEEIDAHRAEEARVRAEEQIMQKNSLLEYHIAQANVARAMARLRVKNRSTII